MVLWCVLFELDISVTLCVFAHVQGLLDVCSSVALFAPSSLYAVVPDVPMFYFFSTSSHIVMYSINIRCVRSQKSERSH